MGTEATALQVQSGTHARQDQSSRRAFATSSSSQPNRERRIAEEYINYVASNSIFKAMSQAEIVDATREDPTLQRLEGCLRSGKWPSMPELRLFYPIRSELSVINGLVLRGRRIVIPVQLRQRTLQLAHEGHQGIVRTKQLLREKVWWPGIDPRHRTDG